MPEEALKCITCNELFHNDGVQLIIHGQTIGHVCPSCIASLKSFHLLVKRESVRKPYVLTCIIPLEMLDKDPETT
jgi:hypothetical protein